MEMDGNCPVQIFLDDLETQEQGKIFQVIQLLEERGPTLPFPFSSQVEGKLRELRVQYGKYKYRVLYYADVNRSFVLLHALSKKTDKLSAEDRRIALNRMAVDMEHKKKEGGKRA